MKRSLGEDAIPNTTTGTMYENFGFPIDCLILVYKFFIEDGNIVEPQRLLLLHSINQELYKRTWCDREYLQQLFWKASQKSQQLFEKERHGKYLQNYLFTHNMSKAMPMITMIWDRIGPHLKITDTTRYEPRRDYYNPGIPLFLSDLFEINGDNNDANYKQYCEDMGMPIPSPSYGRIPDHNRNILYFIFRYMKIRHGWEVGFDTNIPRIDQGSISYDNVIVLRLL